MTVEVHPDFSSSPSISPSLHIPLHPEGRGRAKILLLDGGVHVRCEIPLVPCLIRRNNRHVQYVRLLRSVVPRYTFLDPVGGSGGTPRGDVNGTLIIQYVGHA